MTKALTKVCGALTGLLMAVTAPVNGVDYKPAEQSGKSCCDTQSDCVNVYGELLYWRPSLGGLESAFGNTAITTSLNGTVITTAITESDVNPHFNWNTGYRIGTDVTFGCLDVAVDWTHFKGGAKFHEDTQYGHWDIRYDVVDLTAGRSFGVGSCFTLTPFIGVRFAQIHQTLNSHLETVITTLVGVTTLPTVKHDKENFWGVGPEIGIEADWDIGCDFSIYGSIDLVTYYGRVKNRNFESSSFPTTLSLAHGKIRHDFLSAATDIALGVRWDKNFCCSCYNMNFMLKAGVEQHRIYDFSNLGSDGTLSLDGAVFAAGIGLCY